MAMEPITSGSGELSNIKGTQEKIGQSCARSALIWIPGLGVGGLEGLRGFFQLSDCTVLSVDLSPLSLELNT